MSIWFTSDTHFGHANIIRFCDRPFKDVDHMNEEIVRRWNSVVMPDDVVYHLGDVALGRIADSLPHVGRLNGRICLVEGNHDRTFENRNKPTKYERWVDEYGKYFDRIMAWNYTHMNINGRSRMVNMSHFPYDGDSHDGDRFTEVRLKDAGIPLVHGHTHSGGDPVSRSKRGTLQIHVGMDAWDYTPVPYEKVEELVKANL